MALLDELLEHLSLSVKKDDIVKKTIQTVAISAYTDNPLNLFMKGPTSVGKSYITVNSLQYWPEKDVWMLGGLSPTALVHDSSFGTFEDQNGREVGEGFDEKDQFHFYFKDSGENVPKTEYKRLRKIIDLKSKTLVFLEAPNYKTYMMLRPILSHDVKETMYKFTDTSSKGGLKTLTVVLRNWPATIFCTTESKFMAELISRSITISPAEDIDKYKEANKLTGEKVAFPDLKDDPKLEELRRNVSQVAGYVKSSRVKGLAPAGAYRYADLPHHIPDDMRHYKQYFAIIANSALLNLETRPVIEYKKSKMETWRFVIATKYDYDLFAEFYKEFGESTRAGLPKKALELYNKIIVVQEHPLSAKEIAERASKAGIQRTPKQIRDYELKHLMAANFIQPAGDPNDKRALLYESLGSIDLQQKLDDYSRLLGIRELSIFFSETEAEDWLIKIGDKMRIINDGFLEPVFKLGVESTTIDRQEFISLIINPEQTVKNENRPLSPISITPETISDKQNGEDNSRAAESRIKSSNSGLNKDESPYSKTFIWRCLAGHGPYSEPGIIREHQKDCEEHRELLKGKRD